MTLGPQSERYRQPTVKRLGMEDGWWFFCPHFLNLGVPLVFVDTCLVPEAGHRGLEVLGEREPDTPLLPAGLRIRSLGDGLSFYGTGRQPPLLASHWFRTLNLPQSLHSYPVIGVIVGDSYALQLTWSALWRCRIGTVAQVDTDSWSQR